MLTIHKFILNENCTGSQQVQIQRGAAFLHIAEQHGKLCMWAVVDIAEPMQPMTIEVIGTGYSLPTVPVKYLGTAVMTEGYVWHVFEHVIG